MHVLVLSRTKADWVRCVGVVIYVKMLCDESALLVLQAPRMYCDVLY